MMTDEPRSTVGGDGGSPKPDKPPSDAAAKGWFGRNLKFAAISGAIVTAGALTSEITNLTSVAQGFYGWVRSKFVDAEVQAELRTCQADRIVLRLKNVGGREARFGRPIISIESGLPVPPEGLNIPRFIARDPFQESDKTLTPDEVEDLDYTHADPQRRLDTPFFSEEEQASPDGCTIRALIPIEEHGQVEATPCECGDAS